MNRSTIPLSGTTSRRRRLTSLVAAGAMAVTAIAFQPTASVAAANGPCSALPGGVPLGFCTFNGGGDTVAISNATDASPQKATLVQMDIDVSGCAGFIRGLTNEAGDTWVTQDWSTSEGISFWFYGNNSGTTVFVDILENPNPGSTVDDALRWTVDWVDNFDGWAPGMLNTEGALTFHVDDVGLRDQ